MPYRTKGGWFRSILFTVILTFVVAIISIPTIRLGSSSLESRFWPVASHLQVTRIVENKDSPSIMVWGKLNRAARACDLVDVHFYQKGNNFGDFLIPSQREKPPRDQIITGQVPFGPWRVFTTKEAFQTNTYIKVFHDCHPFYLTESIIYNTSGIGQSDARQE